LYSIAVGLASGFAYFAIEDVEIYLKTLDGVFPKVASFMETAPETTFLNVHRSDADFLLSKIDKLPGGTDNESPIYLSLDVAVWVRAYDQPKKTGVALELSRSTFTGKSVNVSLNRQFLRNALQFGCHKIGIDPLGDKPIICTGDDKFFVCMPLEGTEPEAEHMDVIASELQSTVAAPKATATVPASAVPAPARRRRRVTAKRDVVKPTDKAALLITAEKIRTDMRSSLMEMNSLIREVKAQRQKDRLLQTTMDSLRKLSL